MDVEKFRNDSDYREKIRNQKREWRKNNIDKCRNANFKCDYGITLEEYNNVLNSQNGSCKICGSSESLNLDYDHDNKRIRGILCRSCKHILNCSKYNSETLYNGANYIRKYR